MSVRNDISVNPFITHSFAAYMAVGVPGAGSGGFINLLAAITDGKIVAGVFCIVAFGGWIFNAIYSLWMWKEVHGVNSAAGHTLENAKNEAVTFGARSGAAQVCTVFANYLDIKTYAMRFVA